MNDQVTEKERVVPDTSSDPGKETALKPPILVQVIATRDWDEGVGFQLRWEFPKDVWNSGAMVFAKDTWIARSTTIWSMRPILTSPSTVWRMIASG